MRKARWCERFEFCRIAAPLTVLGISKNFLIAESLLVDSAIVAFCLSRVDKQSIDRRPSNKRFALSSVGLVISFIFSAEYKLFWAFENDWNYSKWLTNFETPIKTFSLFNHTENSCAYSVRQKLCMPSTRLYICRGESRDIYITLLLPSTDSVFQAIKLWLKLTALRGYCIIHIMASVKSLREKLHERVRPWPFAQRKEKFSSILMRIARKIVCTCFCGWVLIVDWFT